MASSEEPRDARLVRKLSDRERKLLGFGGGVVGVLSGVAQFLAADGVRHGLRLLALSAVVNRADPDTCDASGRPPVMGLFQARTFVIHGDGTWSFTDGLGYDEAVTYARNYEIVDASPAALAVIRNDRDDWNRKHPGSNDYAGMTALPAGAKVLATFRQPPGRYEGKGSPCKNT
jgi:hypothetical protein